MATTTTARKPSATRKSNVTALPTQKSLKPTLPTPTPETDHPQERAAIQRARKTLKPTLAELENQLRDMARAGVAAWESASAGMAEVIAAVWRAKRFGKATETPEYKAEIKAYWQGLGIGGDANDHLFTLSATGRRAVIKATPGATLAEHMAMTGASMPTVTRDRRALEMQDSGKGRKPAQKNESDGESDGTDATPAELSESVRVLSPNDRRKLALDYVTSLSDTDFMAFFETAMAARTESAA